MTCEEKKYKNLQKQGFVARILKHLGALVEEAKDTTHGNTGKSNRPFRPDKQNILRIAQEKYPAFGGSHLCELLKERECKSVLKETLRHRMKRLHKYHPKKKRMRPSVLPVSEIYFSSVDVRFGRERACLMNIVDDDTNIDRLHFERKETIQACVEMVGVPQAFYADGRNMYHLDPDKEHHFFTMMCEVWNTRHSASFSTS